MCNSRMRARRERDLQTQINPAARAQRLGIEVRQGRRIAVGPAERRRAERLQRVECDDPWRYGRREALCQKGAQRLVLPHLDVARRPVVQQAHAEDVLLRPLNRYRFAEIIPRSDEGADLQLVIEPATRGDERFRRTIGLHLAHRAAHGCAAGYHRRGPAVIRDRHVLVVWQQRLVGPEHAADVRRMKHRRVEIGVIADVRGQQHRNGRPGHEQRLDCMLVNAWPAAICAQPLADRGTEVGPHVGSKSHQFVQRRRPARVAHKTGRVVEHAALGTELQVEDLVANRHSDAPRGRRGSAERAERKILDREIAAGCVGRRHPAAQPLVVRRVDGHHVRQADHGLFRPTGLHLPPVACSRCHRYPSTQERK